MKSILIIFILSLQGIASAASRAPACANCSRADALIAEIDQKRIKCEPMNPSTFQIQSDFVRRGTLITRRLLTEASFNDSHAQQVWLMVAKVAAYDVESFLIQDIGLSQFRQRQALLNSAMDRLVQSGKVSAALKLQLQEYVGLIPNKDRLKDIRCEF